MGRTVWLANGHVRTIVGVVGDVYQTGVGDGIAPTMYMPTSWVIMPTMTLVVRTTGEPAAMAPTVRQAVRRVDPQQPVFDVRTMDDQARASAAQSRLNATLLGLFALLALVLGSVGVAGVVAQAVSSRRPELAIRIALGARASRVVRQVASEGIRLCLCGLVAGVAGALAAARVLSSLLAGMRVNDLTIIPAVVLALLAIAVAACWTPASRVTRIDPANVLRGE